MKMTKKTRALTVAGSCGVAAVLAAIAGSTGCELLVDFDRTLIDSGIPDTSFADVPINPGDAPVADGFVADSFGADANRPPEAGVDAGSDATTAEAGVDSGAESGVDAGVDSGIDTGVDAGVDAPVDAGFASFAITPAAGAFGTVAQGTTTDRITFTITNLGTVAGTPSTIVASGDFAATPAAGCASSIAPNGTCTVTVTFTPTATGARTGTLSASPPNGAAAALSGTGAPTGVITITPATFDFPATTDGQTSADQSFTVTNTDPNSGITLAPTLDGQDFASFGIDPGASTTCGTTLGPSATCIIAVQFKPLVAGPRYGNLAVTAADADAGTSGTASASFTGVGQ